MRHRLAAVAMVSVLVVAAGCSDDGDGGAEQAGSTTSTTASAPEYEPVFEESTCLDALPDSPRLRCGWLTVPEDRADPGGRQVRLPVAIIRTEAPSPEPDPIIYFSGGPGDSALRQVEYFLEKDFGGARDVILFDQRGTGAAEPSLDCPEVGEAAWAVFAAADAPAAEEEVGLTALLACRERLETEGVDFDAYDTIASGADVADLRRALEIEQWNLFGVSYGTTLALEVLRSDPDGIRSAVLDSVYPTTATAGAENLAGSAERALDVLFQGCASAPTCAAAFPTFEQDLAAVVEQMNANPFESTVTDPDTGQDRTIVLTGNDLMAGVFYALYDAELIPLLPSITAQLLRGETGILPPLAQEALAFLVHPSEAMTTSVECSDRGRQAAGDTEALLRERPEFSTILSGANLTERCEAWGVAFAPENFNEPVTSDAPALVLAGEYDPVTPPADSRDTADALGNATYVEFPGLGHGEVFSHECPEAIFRAFVADPAAPVDTVCVDEMEGPAWVTQ